MIEEQRKALLAKRAYYSEHPEEAIVEMVKKYDDYVPVGVPPKAQTTEPSFKDESCPHILAQDKK